MSDRRLAQAVRQIRRLARPPAVAPVDDRALLASFATSRDEAAFAELVRRHGPLVRGVCRRVLGDADAADDVFQATFLVLARKAGAVRWRAAVGPWLYAVAVRLARKARVQRGRPSPSASEGVFQSLRWRSGPDDPSVTAAWRELCHVLDEELSHLPDRLRGPLVLCYLNGRTRDEAAAALGWTLATLKRRLERGRTILRQRLERRGLTAGLLAAAVEPAAVPAELSAATAAAAASFASDGTTAGPVAALLGGGKRVVRLTLLAGVIAVAASGVALAPRGLTPAPDTNLGALTQPRSPEIDRKDKSPELPKGAVARLGSQGFFVGHDLSLATLGPGGKLLATGWHGNISIWQLADGNEAFDAVTPAVQRDGRHRAFAACHLSEDQQRLVTVEIGPQRIVRTTDLTTGAEVSRFAIAHISDDTLGAAKHGERSDFVFSPDGHRLAVLEADGTVAVYDVAAGKQVVRFASSFGSTSMAFSGDGRTLVSAARPVFQVWDLPTGKERRQFASPPEAVARMVLSPDGRQLATVGRRASPGGQVRPDRDDENRVRLWDVALGTEVRSVTAYRGGVAHIAWAPDGKTFFTAAWSKGEPVRQWDAMTGSAVATFDRPPGWLTALLVTPNGRQLLAPPETGELARWDIATSTRVIVADRLPSFLGLVWTGEGSLLTINRTGFNDNVVRHWDVILGRVNRRTEMAIWLTPSRDGSVLAASKSVGSRELDIWDARMLKPIRAIATRGMARAFSPEGKLLATSSASSAVQLWSIATGTAVKSFAVPDEQRWYATEVAFTPDGGQLLAIGNELTRTASWKCHVWDVATTRLVHSWKLADSGVVSEKARNILDVPRHKFSPTGELIAFLCRPDEFRAYSSLVLCDAKTGKVVRAFAVPSGGPFEFSPDGMRLAVVDDERPFAVHVFHVGTGKELTNFQGHRGPVGALAFSVDGKRLASASTDTTVLIWDVSDLPHPTP